MIITKQINVSQNKKNKKEIIINNNNNNQKNWLNLKNLKYLTKVI